jgi:hypothetical protein
MQIDPKPTYADIAGSFRVWRNPSGKISRIHTVMGNTCKGWAFRPSVGYPYAGLHGDKITEIYQG